ncbi:isopentenyl transferase family protein [Streptomyces nanshensis]|uniref:isopentenyl transferase family protein n=1 Tax=Streptomyces nanshensis TaxID=518642 RepID=UPI00085BD1C0|nr:isopentenyl transferase family protein [Streptomyces nanshensis]
MDPYLHLVLGPTGIGKTSRSVELARREAAPVLVLDRIQCHPALAVGSGRPTPGELRGTTRVYLDRRQVSDGVLTAADAVDRMERLVKQLADTGASTIVLEGGSISTTRELLARPTWFWGRRVHIEYVLEGDPDAYERRVSTRVERMLGYGTTARTILDELAGLWRVPAARPVLRSVTGYREVLELCRRFGLDPTHLAGDEHCVVRYLFVDAVRAAHLAYSRDQRAALAAALGPLRETGCAVTVREV